MIARILALAVVVAPAIGLAQTPPPAGTQPAANEPAKQPAPEPAAKEPPKGGIALEALVGPLKKKFPDSTGLGYGFGIRFLKHHGLHTDFGLQLLGGHSSADDLSTPNGTKFEATQNQIGGGLELDLGFGIGPVEIFGGGGAGLSWVTSDITHKALNKTISTSDAANFYVSYGGALAVNVGRLRPVLRVTKVIDTSFDSDKALTGDAGGLMILLGLGLEVSQW